VRPQETGIRFSHSGISTGVLYAFRKSPEKTTSPRSWVRFLFILGALILTTGMVCGCVGIPGTSSPLLVSYQRTGGIAGFSDHLSIYENGSVAVTRNGGVGHCVLDRGTIEGMKTMFIQADFPALADDYPAPSPGADYFRYAITYQGKIVTTETTGVPPALEPIITALDGMVARCGPGPGG
jgi:hypothetical protein